MKVGALAYRMADAQIEAEEESRSFNYVAATETNSVMRTVYDEERDDFLTVPEILRCDPKAVRFNAHATLFNHNPDRIVGSIQGLEAKDGEVRGTSAFDDTNEGNEAMSRVRSGSLRGVSVGYSVKKYRLVREGETWENYRGPALIATDWEIREVSLTPIQADVNSGVREAGDLRKSGVAVSIDTGTIDQNQQEAEDMFKRMGLRSLLFAPDNGASGGGAAVEPETPVTKPESSERTPEGGDVKTRTTENVQTVDKSEDIRAAQIVTYCELFDVSLQRAGTFINDKTLSAEDVRIKLKQERDEKTNAQDHRAVGGNSRHVELGTDNAREAFLEGAADALVVRAGLVDGSGKIRNATGKDPVKLHGSFGQYTGLRFMDLARVFVRDFHGRNLFGKSDAEVISALRDVNMRSGYAGTGDWTVMLGNALNKQMDIAYQLQGYSYQQWCRMIPANDLREHPLYQKGGMRTLKKIGENGEVPFNKIFDGKKESVTPETYSGRYGLTDDAIINDDLGFLSGFATDAGETAGRTVNEVVYHKLLSNPTMNEDSTALFHADHGNYAASSGAPSVTTLDAAYAAMMKQTNRAGKPINVMPAWILAPVALRGTVLQLLNSEWVPGETNETRNIYNGALDPIFEPLLDLGVTIETDGSEPSTVSGSAVGWYIGARNVSTFVIAEYGGSAPIVDQARPLDVLGTEFRITKRFGVAPSDYRGLYFKRGS